MPDIFISPSKDNTHSVKPDIVPPPVKNKSRLQVIGKLLASYQFMPEDIKFETQSPGETVLLLLRKHWITNIVWIFTSLVFIITPIIFFPVLILNINLDQYISMSAISFISIFWYLITFTYIYVNFLLWSFNVWIVTNERVIDIVFINLLNKKYAETRIAKIEDITMRTGGFIRSVMDFGDVHVQTAAKEAVFLFSAVPHPEKIVRILNELMGKEENKGGSHQ